MNDLETLLADQENIAGELIGLDGLSGELFGQLASLDAVKRARALQKLAKRPAPSRGSRSDMEKFLGQMPDHIKMQLKKGGLRLADHTIYSIKPANSKVIKMFEPQDEKKTGMRNIANAKLPKNMAFMVSGIIVRAGVSVDGTDANVLSTSYREIDVYGHLINGEHSLKANKKQITPEDSSNMVFATTNDHRGIIGYRKLDNPRLIRDEEEIEFTFNLGTDVGLPANLYLYVALVGTATIP